MHSNRACKGRAGAGLGGTFTPTRHPRAVARPTTKRVGSSDWLGPAAHTEEKRPNRNSKSVSPATHTSGWRMSMISPSGGRRQVVVTTVAWLAHHVPLTSQPGPRESRTGQIGNPSAIGRSRPPRIDFARERGFGFVIWRFSARRLQSAYL